MNVRDWISFTNIVLAVFFLYFLNAFYTFYVLFNPESCQTSKERCLAPYTSPEDKLEVSLA